MDKIIPDGGMCERMPHTSSGVTGGTRDKVTLSDSPFRHSRIGFRRKDISTFIFHPTNTLWCVIEDMLYQYSQAFLRKKKK